MYLKQKTLPVRFPIHLSLNGDVITSFVMTQLNVFTAVVDLVVLLPQQNFLKYHTNSIELVIFCQLITFWQLTVTSKATNLTIPCFLLVTEKASIKNKKSLEVFLWLLLYLFSTASVISKRSNCGGILYSEVVTPLQLKKVPMNRMLISHTLLLKWHPSWKNAISAKVGNIVYVEFWWCVLQSERCRLNDGRHLLIDKRYDVNCSNALLRFLPMLKKKYAAYNLHFYLTYISLHIGLCLSDF